MRPVQADAGQTALAEARLGQKRKYVCTDLCGIAGNSLHYNTERVDNTRARIHVGVASRMHLLRLP